MVKCLFKYQYFELSEKADKRMETNDGNDQKTENTGSDPIKMADNSNTKTSTHDIPLVFMQESSLFGKRVPTEAEWIKHVDLFCAIGTRIDESHIKGLQRIRGMWRIYLDNLTDKCTLMAEGIPLRGKIIPVLGTNPDRMDGENTIRIRVKNIPLSVDDGVITRQFTLMKIDVISCYRERLRVRGKLTNCETGDRLITVKASTLKSPLSKFMSFGQFSARVIHQGQEKPVNSRPKECSKCLMPGHTFAHCPNEYVCSKCNLSGHKRADCMLDDSSNEDSEAADTETDERYANGEEEQDLNLTIKSVPNASSPKPVQNELSANPVISTSHEKSNLPKVQNAVQQHMDKFLNKTETPNKGRQQNAPARSPPTPTETLHASQNQNKNQSGKRKKNK